MTESSQPSVDYWVRHLKLEPHPEGGFYQAVTRGNYTVANQKALPRFAYTTIYFLLTPDSPSHLHRLASDETWFYHAGDPLQVHVLLQHPDDEERIRRPDVPRQLSAPSAHDADEATASAQLPAVPPEAYPMYTSFTPSHMVKSEGVTENAANDGADAASRDAYQTYRCVPVGPRVHMGEALQYTVPANAIFGSSVAPDGTYGYSLVSCVVSPGFDFRDFELFTQDDLMRLCPQHEAVIRAMAYETIPES